MHSIPNISAPLSRAIYAELCTLLPPPPDDTPETRALRDEHAMTAVAHLLPENAAEANVAVLIVAAQARAREAFRAAAASLDPDTTRRCTAQAASMMRQADSFTRTLMRMQAERQKAEDACRPAAMQRAGYWFRSVSPDPGPHPEPEPERPPLPSREGDGGRGAALPKLEYGAMTPAERFVTLYPDRAAQVLAAGGLPARPAFPPPEPAVIAELLAGDSPLVRAFRQTRTPEPVAA